MFHSQFSRHDLYHPNPYQQQCQDYTDHLKVPTVLATHNRQCEVILQNAVFGQPDDPVTPSHYKTHTPTTVSGQSVMLGTDFDKKKKVASKKGNVDTSNFSIEERLVAAVWVHERKHSKNSIRQIKHEFKQRFGRDPPAKNTLLVWERKLFSTGSVHDAPRTGRPVNRRNRVDEVAASVCSAPSLSLRARALSLRLPRTTLRTILQRDLAADLAFIRARAQDGTHAPAGKQQRKREVQRRVSKK